MITVHNIGIIFNKLLNESILLDRRLSFFFYAFVILKKNEKKERERNVNAFFSIILTVRVGIKSMIHVVGRENVGRTIGDLKILFAFHQRHFLIQFKRWLFQVVTRDQTVPGNGMHERTDSVTRNGARFRVLQPGISRSLGSTRYTRASFTRRSVHERI